MNDIITIITPEITTLGFIKMWLTFIKNKYGFGSIYDMREYILYHEVDEEYIELINDIRTNFIKLTPNDIFGINDGDGVVGDVDINKIPGYILDHIIMIIIEMIIANVNDHVISGIYIGYDVYQNILLEKNMIVLTHDEKNFNLEFNNEEGLKIENVFQLNKDIRIRDNFYQDFLRQMGELNYEYFEILENS